MAQEVVAACMQFAEHGLRNITVSVSSRALLNRVHDKFCNEEYDALSIDTQAEFGMVVEMIPFDFSGGAGGSKEKHVQFCRDYKQLTVETEDDLQITNLLYARAIDAWSHCIELARKDVFLSASIPESGRFVDVTMKYTGPAGSVAFNGVETSEMNCTMNGVSVGAATSGEITSEESQLRCERSFNEQDVGGIKAAYFPPAAVTVKTAAGILPVEFAEMVDAPAKKLLDAIKADIAGLDTALVRIRNAMNAWGEEQSTDILYDQVAFPLGKIHLDVMRDVGPVYCPAGSYVAGVSLQTTTHGECNGCLGGVQLVCRKLGTP
jgi:hypothetical protein